MLPIYLINLPRRTDRLLQSTQLLNSYGLPFTVFPAIECADGREGLRRTMIALFKSVNEEILVLEDDVDFCIAPTELLPQAILELSSDVDLLFLGANVYKPMEQYSEHLLRLSGAVANHAVIYTQHVMAEMKVIYSNSDEPTDLLLDRHIVSRGHSYITNPKIAIQRPGYSDIEKKETDYRNLLEDRYNKEIAKLKPPAPKGV